MRALVIGGTRNLGPSLVASLLEAGYEVTVFNRGLTPGELPGCVTRVYGDRSDPAQLRAGIAGRSFDLVVDTALYNAADAEAAAALLTGRVGRYVFLSTGQVYLVREGAERPYREEMYEGPLTPAPSPDRVFDHEEWTYGVEKRGAEDVLLGAHHRRGFPVTTLRLPMVNSEGDHFDRIYGYLARLRDGGPLVVPDEVHLPLRHVYGEDVVRAVVRLGEVSVGIGRAYNVSQDETVSFGSFLGMLAELTGEEPRIVRAPIARLEALGLIPYCSPFSEPWMSELDNSRGKAELGLVYTPPGEYLPRLVAHFDAQAARPPRGYENRAAELRIARDYAA